MNYASAACFEVQDVAACCRVFTEVLDFSIVESSGGRCSLGNGALTILLLECSSPRAPVYLVMDVDSVTDYMESLLTCGFRILEDISQNSDGLVEAVLQGPEDIRLRLSHLLTEDEREELAALPTTLEWDDDARLFTQKILVKVPLAFRDGARGRYVTQAETSAIVDGEMSVSLCRACSAIVAVTPDFKLASLVSYFSENGVDPAPYFSPAILAESGT